MGKSTLLLAWVLLLAGTVRPEEKGDFLALCYHDVQDVVNDPDGMAVSTADLVAQFQWLAENDFHPVSIDDLVAASRGKKKLPPHPVLLTFDDGFRSFYTRVYPLLKLFHYPAVLSLVGKWQEVPPGKLVDYGGKPLPRERFVTWKEVREMTASGLVEIASHSFDLHHGVPANPQGNLQPALRTRIYDPQTGTYEKDDAYLKRVRRDLAESRKIILSGSGKAPRVVTWPYGKYTMTALEAARSLGFTLSLALKEERPNRLSSLSVIHRRLVYRNPRLDEFVWTLRHPLRMGPRRFLFVDMDSLFAVDPLRREKKLGLLLDRVKDLAINRVCLKAWWDRNGDGKADALFFPNRSLPVRADLLNRAAWQLWTRSGVEVYVEMPAPDDFALPFPAVPDVFGDLGRYADFSGLLLPVKADKEKSRKVLDRIRNFLPDLFLGRRIQGDVLPAGGKGRSSALPIPRLLAENDLLFVDFEAAGEAARRVSALLFPWIPGPAGLEKVVFTVLDPSPAGAGRPFPSAAAVSFLRALQTAGARNIGYDTRYFLGSSYHGKALFPVFSLRDYPFQR